MKRAILGVLIALPAAGCVHGSSLEQVHAGMSREQVASLMGPADMSTSTPGRECAYYTVLKDFWSRVPWNMSDRYYVCFSDGKVETFGRADGKPDTRQSG
jgi:SmpA/OmlA family protein